MHKNITEPRMLAFLEELPRTVYGQQQKCNNIPNTLSNTSFHRFKCLLKWDVYCLEQTSSHYQRQ